MPLWSPSNHTTLPIWIGALAAAYAMSARPPALPRVAAGGIGAGHGDVATGHAEFRRVVQRAGVQPLRAEDVHEPVAETQDHRAVAGEGEAGQFRLRVDERVARLPVVPGQQAG